MARKIFVLVVLCSMMLHCASRMGFLSYLYQQRHEIAYALGLISEVPIAMCSSDYDFSDGLVLQASHDDETSQRTLPMALEIKLFFVSVEVPVIDMQEAGADKTYGPLWSRPLHGCLRSIFHPPALLS